MAFHIDISIWEIIINCLIGRAIARPHLSDYSRKTDTAQETVSTLRGERGGGDDESVGIRSLKLNITLGSDSIPIRSNFGPFLGSFDEKFVNSNSDSATNIVIYNSLKGEYYSSNSSGGKEGNTESVEVDEGKQDRSEEFHDDQAAIVDFELDNDNLEYSEQKMTI